MGCNNLSPKVFICRMYLYNTTGETDNQGKTFEKVEVSFIIVTFSESSLKSWVAIDDNNTIIGIMFPTFPVYAVLLRGIPWVFPFWFIFFTYFFGERCNHEIQSQWNTQICWLYSFVSRAFYHISVRVANKMVWLVVTVMIRCNNKLVRNWEQIES